MKKIYSTLMMLSLMVASLSFTACSSDDDDSDGNYDDNEYFQITINGETFNDHCYGGMYLDLPSKIKNGKEVNLYGFRSEAIMISSQDALQYAIIVGDISLDMSSIYPKSTGTYDITTYSAYSFTEIPDNVGMVITGGNSKYRTVTSGSLKITKVSKVNKKAYGRDCYATEGTFFFTLTDNWDGNENEISGKFRIIL
ncbi:MAG: hypothetical protein K2M96_02575 [Prevotella sp.]|nr:hypothetical protein [Prevotella sp.]